MSAAVWAVILSAIACLIVLAVLIKGLVERLQVLTSSLKRMQERVQPLADVIITEGEVAQERLEAVNRATAGLRLGRHEAAPASAAPGSAPAGPHIVDQGRPA